VSKGIEERIRHVFGEVAAAADRAGRSPESVTVVAVSKTVERDAVDLAYQCGVRNFGENRVQDAARKFAVPLQDEAILHMIGHLQSNKSGVAARLFDIVESVDRESLIGELDKQAAKLERVLPILLQVNIAGEAQKAGCEPAEAKSLLRSIRATPHLELRGLMTIAPLVNDPEEIRRVFRGLRELRDHLKETFPDMSLDGLSMGMTNDFQVAIEEGSTMVRIGRAIFSGD
jgi:pyridoxal phosphate enzyme (YggS family)